MLAQHPPTDRLDNQLKAAAFEGALLLLVVAAVPALSQDLHMAGQCLVQSSLIWLFAWHQAWRRRSLNHNLATGVPSAQLGSANRLTLLRGALIAATGGFIFQAAEGPIVWLPALLYTVAAMLDWLDGFVARGGGQTSQLGKELDTAYDALGLVVAPLVAACYGKVHWTYLAVSAAYYVFQAGLNLRRRRGLATFEMTPSKLRRIVAGIQMAFVSLALWPIFRPEFTRVIGVVVMVPLLTGFAIDWLTVSGRMRSAATQ